MDRLAPYDLGEPLREDKVSEKSHGLASILSEAPRNCWLALNEDETRVVGHGATIEAAEAEAKANGIEEPILLWAPEAWMPQVL